MNSLKAAPVVLLFALIGCFSPIKTVNQRTALDQQLVKKAVERAVEKLQLESLSLSGTYRVKVTTPRGSDADVIRASLERRLHRAGLQVTNDPVADVPTVEATVSFAAGDLQFRLIGVPLFVPGVAVAVGDISVYKSSTQRGRARLGLVLWDVNGNLERHIPEEEGVAYFTNFSFLTFIGSFTSTDMEDFVPPRAHRASKEEPAGEEGRT